MALMVSHPANADTYYPFPDTGQTKCYDNTQEIICPEPSEPFYGQDAQYQSRLPRRYTKLGSGGIELPDTATQADGWIMTFDNVTGLVWEIKTSVTDSHTYTWQEANDVFIPDLNARSFGGYDDWRLPTIVELASLVNANYHLSGPTIDRNMFPFTSSNRHFSSTNIINPNISGKTWGVNFSYGGVAGYISTHSYYVMAVRSDQTTQEKNFVFHDDGTFTDIRTGLMWQEQTATEKHTWQDALFYAESLELAGHTDWRLPSRNELQSLVDYTEQSPLTYTVLKEKTFSAPYWTSTSGASGAYMRYAWRVNFGDGNVWCNDTSDAKTVENYVRVVRNGNVMNIVTPSAGENGSISPSEEQIVNLDDTTTFTITPNEGYTATVGGTCGGTLVDDTFTTDPITEDCTVEATFTEESSPEAIPTLSQWGMFILAFLILVLGGFCLARMRLDTNQAA